MVENVLNAEFVSTVANSSLALPLSGPSFEVGASRLAMSFEFQYCIDVTFNVQSMQMKARETNNTTKTRAAELFQVADRQGGYFSAGQALALGYSRRLHHYHRQQGHWLEVNRGLFRLRDYPVTPDEELVKLSLWSRDLKGQPQAVISHETALRLYDLSDLMPSKIHLSVPKNFRKTPPEGVVLHKTAVEPNDVEARSGFRVTSPMRTLIDVADMHISPEHLKTATQQALERGLVRRKRLEAAITKFGTSNRLERVLRSL